MLKRFHTDHCHHQAHVERSHTSKESQRARSDLGPSWWCCLVVLHVNIGLVILNPACVRQVDCSSTDVPSSSHLLERHEGLLVDLLHEQQGEFLAELRKNDQTNDQVSNRRFQTKWIPVATVNQRPAQRPVHASNSSMSQLRLKPAESIGIPATQTSGQTTREPCQKSKRAASGSAVAESTNMSQQQDAALAKNFTSASKPKRDQFVGLPSEQADEGEDDEESEPDEDEDSDQVRQPTFGRATLLMSPKADLLDGRASVALESSIIPPPLASDDYEQPQQRFAATANSMQNQRRFNGAQQAMQNSEPNGGDEDETGENSPATDAEGQDEQATANTPDAEAAERREQEAAEASEAEEANRSALAEQQQQQREIIMAQAQSEAKAIREQQDALLKQQQLQQQMLMRRHQNFLDDDAKTQRDRRKTRFEKQQRQQRANLNHAAGEGDNRYAPTSRARQSQLRAAPSSNHQQQVRRDQNRNRQQVARTLTKENRHTNVDGDDYDLTGASLHQIDNQFSDQPDNGIVDRGTGSAARPTQRELQRANGGTSSDATEELGGSSEDSASRTQFEPEIAAASDSNRVSLGAPSNLTAKADLVAAAQHHYGAHYGSLDAHHGGFGGYILDAGHSKKKSAGYNQWAESHKKGQFDSGFMRGNKKFVISGKSSQHKSHAQGHVKWHGKKKGKGSHHWDYKHKNKKHYGSGYGYGGGHHYY